MIFPINGTVAIDVIVDLPGAIAVIKPSLPVTVTTDVLLLVHVIDIFEISAPGTMYDTDFCAISRAFAVSPTLRFRSGSGTANGVILFDVVVSGSFVVTFTLQVMDFDSDPLVIFAVIVALPVAFAVTVPSFDTVAIYGLLLLHATVHPDGVVCAINLPVSPTLIERIVVVRVMLIGLTVTLNLCDLPS